MFELYCLVASGEYQVQNCLLDFWKVWLVKEIVCHGISGLAVSGSDETPGLLALLRVCDLLARWV